MSRVPLHAPRAALGAVAFRGTDRKPVGLAVSLAWLVVGAAIGLTAAGAQHPTVELGPITPVATAAVAGSPTMRQDPVAHDPMTWRRWPGTLTTSTQLQPIPAFVGVDDPPGAGPLPAADPAVARLLAQLREEAKGSPTDVRPGPEALAALDFAAAQVGRPYVWGAIGPDSYDCSGLTWRAYAQAGVALPRVSADQHARGGTAVAIADLLPGDLVFFATAAWDPGAVHHVGMYVGRGLMVDAPRPGAYVRVEQVTAAGYVGAVRVVPARPASATPTPSASPSATPTGAGTAQPSDSPTAPASDPPGTSGGLPIPTSDTPSDPSSDTPTTDPTSDPTSDPTPDPTADPTPDPTTDPRSGSLTIGLAVSQRTPPVRG